MAETEWSRTPFGAEHLGLIGEVALLAGQLEFFVQELSIVLTESGARRQTTMNERNRLLHGTWRWDLLGLPGESDARLSSRKRHTGRRSDPVAVLPQELALTADALQSAGLRLRQVMFEVAQELGALDELARRQSLNL
jgi:hypothetical protein